MNRTHCLLLVALLATGCATAYKPPKQGEPAALVKVKFAYDHAKALTTGASNRSLGVSVVLEEEKKQYVLATKRYDGLLQQDAPAPLETMAFSLHPDRDVMLVVLLGVYWQTTTTRTVPRTERDARGNTVTRQVQETVTNNHVAGCRANVSLRPGKDATYLVDYANMAITEGCTAQTYLQTAQPDGSFKLTPL